MTWPRPACSSRRSPGWSRRRAGPRQPARARPARRAALAAAGVPRGLGRARPAGPGPGRAAHRRRLLTSGCRRPSGGPTHQGRSRYPGPASGGDDAQLEGVDVVGHGLRGGQCQADPGGERVELLARQAGPHGQDDGELGPATRPRRAADGELGLAARRGRATAAATCAVTGRRDPGAVLGQRPQRGARYQARRRLPGPPPGAGSRRRPPTGPPGGRGRAPDGPGRPRPRARRCC